MESCFLFHVQDVPLILFFTFSLSSEIFESAIMNCVDLKSRKIED